MLSMCGVDCCGKCARKEECGGCVKTEGRPFGGRCIAAECIKKGGFEALKKAKCDLIDEINALGISDLHIEDLSLLNGFYVNLEYPLANGQSVKLLEDKNVYFGNQVEIPGSESCYGMVADEEYLLVCEYKCNGTDPKIICYKKRENRI
ncbi:hypothetical protein B5F13_10985 [Drancourtella sp. An177]|nr:hypothetical protein B5F13_10985 [Drancourtella sp. An177]